MKSDLLARTPLMAEFFFFHAVTLAKELVDVFATVKGRDQFSKGIGKMSCNSEKWRMKGKASKREQKDHL